MAAASDAIQPSRAPTSHASTRSRSLRADVEVAAASVALGRYNFACSLPLWTILILRPALGQRSDASYGAIDCFLASGHTG